MSKERTVEMMLMSQAKALGQAWAIIDGLVTAKTKFSKNYWKKRANEWLKVNK